MITLPAIIGKQNVSIFHERGIQMPNISPQAPKKGANIYANRDRAYNNVIQALEIVLL